MYMYTYNIHIMCMYYGVVQGLASPFWRCIAKRGRRAKTLVCVSSLLPPGVPSEPRLWSSPFSWLWRRGRSRFCLGSRRNSAAG